MTGELRDPDLPGIVLNHVPNQAFGDTLTPMLPCATEATEDLASADVGGSGPVVDGRFDPVWDRHSPNVTALSDQISDKRGSEQYHSMNSTRAWPANLGAGVSDCDRSPPRRRS